MSANPYSRLPRTDDLLAAAAELVADYGRDQVKWAVDRALDNARQAIAGGAPAPAPDALITRAGRTLAVSRAPGPRRVINAAGIVIHTNLGRAPLSPAAREAVTAAAAYCDLEFDLSTGERGSRGTHVDHLLAAATGADDGMVVNNCAAALVLALAALADGRQVPVSRGHLVEIGGSFRLPAIMAASGAQLLEVGTTNRTRADDYRSGDDVAALLTVHPSNFTQTGFVSQPSLAAVAGVAADRAVPLIHDAGSGLLVDAPAGPLAQEVSMAGALRDGADLVLASGDKLLGGPQAGLIVGRTDLITRLRRHPLARALRIDKLRLAALNATLRDHLRGVGSAVDDLLGTQADLADRVQALRGRVGGRVEESVTMVGGGSAPGEGVVSPVLVIDDEGLAERLRRHDPPVVARVRRGATIVDLRTVDPADDPTVRAAIGTCMARDGHTADDAAAPGDPPGDA